ncbi:hypothetical protein B0J18DRAFT_344518, partial [Chaetomium sp. MPI-SDFR-AT-0129]
ILLLCSWLLVLYSHQHHLQWDLLPFLFTPDQEPPVEVVVASTRAEDTLWVHRFLPRWARSIYVVDNLRARLTVPENKGREAMVYLTHIVNNYDTLAETTVFVHASRFAWHNDNRDYDLLPALHRLRLDYVQESGYVNLRCVQVLGCPAEIRPHIDAASDWARSIGSAPIGDGSGNSRALTTKEIYKAAFEELMPGVDVPQQVGVSCCSQFAVSRKAVRSRSREDYVRWREWLLETSLPDDLSGRVFEYMWHIIFGKEAVYCPSAADCYCKLFGECGLKCQEMQCEGRYILPKYSNLPEGWPQFGYAGEDRNFTG